MALACLLSTKLATHRRWHFEICLVEKEGSGEDLLYVRAARKLLSAAADGASFTVAMFKVAKTITRTSFPKCPWPVKKGYDRVHVLL